MPTKTVTTNNVEKKIPIFSSNEAISGTVDINVEQGKKLEHLGIKIELLGQTEMFHDRGNFYEFCSVVRELAIGGVLLESQQYPFNFTAEKPYESYNGLN
eukprot:421162_1